jgi:hypothetical protein
MAYSFLADLTVFLHFAFIVFVIAGGVLVRWWPKLVWAHLTAAVWGAYVSLANRICPLTPLENWLSRQAGRAGYAGGFMEHHLFWLIYPAGLTPTVQRLLGVGVIVLNVAVYTWLWSHRRARKAPV